MTVGEVDATPTEVDVDPLNRIVRAYHAEWRRVEDAPDLVAFWKSVRSSNDFDRDEEDEDRTLSALIKADLRWRFTRGERPSVDEYLSLFPRLRTARERMVSLVYEEYCLREERGEGVDTEEFCARYSSLQDSLASQLRYHRMFSQLVASPEAPKFPRPGDEFLGFRLLKELGRGGSARVFQAEEIDLGRRPVVLKISPDKGEEPSIQGRLDHPHIARVYSVARQPEGGLRGLSMPYRPGYTLDKVIRLIQAAGRPTGARVFREALGTLGEDSSPSVGWHGFPEGGSYARGVAWMMSKIARALAHAHGRGILHRDVKPANILLTTTDGPLLLDFNLAHAPNTTDEAAAALRGGTLPYMAPEQLLAFLDDARWESVGLTADIYAVGLILTELLTGRRPRLPDPELPLPRAIGELLDNLNAPRRSVHAANPAVPHALDAVIARCLEICPADRYQSATALAEDLEAIAAGEPLVHAENTSRVEKSLGWMSRKRAKLAAGLAVVAVLAVLMFLVRPFVAAHYLREGEVANESGRYREAAEKLRIAQWLTPDDPAIESGLGQVDFGERNYEHAHQRFTHALNLAAQRPGSLTDWQTACLLYRRSQTDLDWAATLDRNNEPRPQSAASSPQRPDLDHQRIREALNDLQLAERLVRTDRPLLYRIGMEKLRGEFYLGVIASGQGEHVAAFEHYVHAQTLATGLLKAVPRHPQATVWQLNVERSFEAIQRHLQSEVPLMLGLESSAPPSQVTTLTEADSPYP